MAEKASLAKFKAVQKKLENMQRKVAKVREVADEKVEHLVRTSEVAVGAFAFGLADGYSGGKADSLANNVGGIPTPLLGAVVLHGLGLFGVGGHLAGHLHSFGDGALAAFASGFGRQIGAVKSANPHASIADVVKYAMKPGTQGSLPAPAAEVLQPDGSYRLEGQRLTDAELAALRSAK